MSQQVKRCPHCEELFLPDKFHPTQKYCLSPACRQQRRRSYKAKYNKEWREQNPNYFKEYWLEYRAFK